MIDRENLGPGETARRLAAARLTGLKVRAVLAAVGALLAAYAGLSLLAAPLAEWIAWGYALSQQQGALPPVHVPQAAPLDGETGLPHAAFLAVTALTIFGFSAGVFRRTRVWVALLPWLAVGAATLYFVPPSAPWLSVMPSRLERDIVNGRQEAARKTLQTMNANAAVKQYVRAQMALRANDRASLQADGEAVLRLADLWAYQRSSPDAHEALATKYAAHFKPPVIHAIDIALNGEPLTHVGLEWQRRSDEPAARTWRLVWPALRAALGLALLVGGLWLVRLWNRQRRRLVALQAVVDAPPAPDLPRDLPGGYAAAPFAGAPGGRAFDAEEPWRSSSGSSLIVLGNFMRARLAGPNRVLLALLVALVVAAGGIRFFSAPPPAPAAMHPCHFIGVWSSIRENSRYKVTLSDDGRYVAEPMVRGPHSGETLRGSWAVSGGVIEWANDKEVRPNLPRDVNEIRDASRSGFTLVEVNGSLTRFELIEPLNSRICAAKLASGGSTDDLFFTHPLAQRRAAEAGNKSSQASPPKETAARAGESACQGTSSNCDNLDKSAEGKLVSAAYARLERVVSRQREGNPPVDWEMAEIAQDHEAMGRVKHQSAYKSAYFRLHGEYQARLDRSFQEPRALKLSCSEYRSKLADLQSQDEKYSEELLGLKRADGVVTDGARARDLNARRIALLGDLKRYQEGAKAGGCLPP